MHKGSTIPVLKNTADIPPHTKLVLFVKPKATVAPLKNATPKDDEHDENASNADQPQAKAKVNAKSSVRTATKAVSHQAKKAKRSCLTLINV